MSDERRLAEEQVALTVTRIRALLGPLNRPDIDIFTLMKIIRDEKCAVVIDESRKVKCVHAGTLGPLDCAFCRPWAERNAALRAQLAEAEADTKYYAAIAEQKDQQRLKLLDEVARLRDEIERLYRQNWPAS